MLTPFQIACPLSFLAAAPCPRSGQPGRNDTFNKCRVSGFLERPPPTWRPDQRGSPLDHKAAERKMAMKPLAGGVAARGTSGRMPAPQRAPAARREQKTALSDAPGTVLRDRFISGGTLWEGPETRCHNVTFVSGSEPPQASVQAGTVTGCALSTRSGQPSRFQLGGRVPGESRDCGMSSSGTDALERNTWTLERVAGQVNNAAPPRP